jgi:hypothetical protein
VCFGEDAHVAELDRIGHQQAKRSDEQRGDLGLADAGPREIYPETVNGQVTAIAEADWASWRRKLQLTETLPEQFDRTLKSLKDFANPVITGSIADPAAWDPVRREWTPAD